MERVKIKLRQTAKQSFQVSVEHREEQTGILPPLPTDLDTAFKHWQSTYRQVEQVRSCIAPEPGSRNFRIGQVKVTAGQLEAADLAPVKYAKQYATEVETGLNRWLDASNARWQSLREYLIRSQEQIPILLDVDNIQLQHFPWQEWDLLETCNTQAEFVLRVKGHSGDEIQPPQKRKRVRILVVVGRSDNISTQDDLDVINKLKVKGAEVVALIQPEVKDLCEALWDKQGYHIFVFTGHSGSQADGQIGWIEVNDRDSLEIEQFKKALKAAIDRGLQLAIFNSCDGLGLANQLAKLNLPRSIVMREPVPDEVAVEFLRHFFEFFASNHSLIESMRKAREKLEHFNVAHETKHFYPGVMWLPTLCSRQSALDFPLTWKGLIQDSPISAERTKWLMSGALGGILLTLTAQQLLKPLFQPPAVVPAQASKIVVDGSSTVYPITQAAAASYQGLNTHITEIKVDVSGTAGGFQKFCTQVTAISNASRPISPQEKELCQQNGVSYVELPIARDAITVIVHPSNTWATDITLEELTKIWQPEAEKVLNHWQDIRSTWPQKDLILYAPGHDSGTFDYFTEAVMGHSGDSRHDYIDSEDDEVLVSGVREHVTSLGYVGFAYYHNNESELKAIPVIHAGQPVMPNVQTVSDGTYPLSRSLFIYVNLEIAQQRADIREFVEYYLENAENFVTRAGYFPLSEKAYETVLNDFEQATGLVPAVE